MANKVRSPVLFISMLLDFFQLVVGTYYILTSKNQFEPVIVTIIVVVQFQFVARIQYTNWKELAHVCELKYLTVNIVEFCFVFLMLFNLKHA